MNPVSEWQYRIVSRVDEAGLPLAEPAEYLRCRDGSDQILTTQNGIVQISNGDEPTPAAEAKAPADNDVDRAISELNAGDREAAPAAGLIIRAAEGDVVASQEVVVAP